MGRYTKREFQLGQYFLAQRAGSPAWYCCWREGNSPRRVSLGTADFEEAKQRLTDWFLLQAKPEAPISAVTIAELIARYWEERGQHTSHPPTTNGHCNHWLDFFGDASVEKATSFTEQERFKTHLIGLELAPQTINNIISTGRAAVRMAWKKGEIPSAPPFTLLQVGDQDPMGRPVSAMEARTLLAELPPHAWLANVLMLGTLARPSAILQLEWPQIDFEHNLINLNKSGRKQNKKRRPIVKMPPFLRAILWSRRSTGRVITFEGEPVKSIRTAWRGARDRAKLDGEVTLYSWRHTLSRLMRVKSVQKWEVQGQLGHGGGVTERYAEFDPEYQKAATAVIEAFWQEIQSGSKLARTMCISVPSSAFSWSVTPFQVTEKTQVRVKFEGFVNRRSGVQSSQPAPFVLAVGDRRLRRKFPSEINRIILLMAFLRDVVGAPILCSRNAAKCHWRSTLNAGTISRVRISRFTRRIGASVQTGCTISSPVRGAGHADHISRSASRLHRNGGSDLCRSGRHRNSAS